MPPRISRGPASSRAPAQPTPRRYNKKRAINAFAIASAETHTDKPEIRANRLGAAEFEPQDRKRRRIAKTDDGNSDVEGEPESEDKGTENRRGTDENIHMESDSEGNEWAMGHVGDDDDSEIDSDAAFGEGEDEAFAGFEFYGSKSYQRHANGTRRKKRTSKDEGIDGLEIDFNSNEDDSNELNSSEEELERDGVDLVALLDEGSDENEAQRPRKHGSKSETQNRYPANEESDISLSDGLGGDKSDGYDSASSNTDADSSSNPFDSDEEEEDKEDVTKLRKLDDLVSTTYMDDSHARRSRADDALASTVPSVSELVSSKKFDIREILRKSSNPRLAKLTKQVGDIPKLPKKDPKLSTPLPKRQKDMLERIAANKKANETLERWVDSVKHIRRAEHLQFPILEPDAPVPLGKEHLLSTFSTGPISTLESTINSILEESGLARNDNAQDQPFESGYDDLHDNSLSVHDVIEKRNQLRRARELLHREEARAKRIKKIKSKSYRRVHRKERERQAAYDGETHEESDMDEEERELHDRRRAEERMGAKHRDSKWAKSMKKTGRSIWDEEARSGVGEMARKSEELRRRIAGKDVRAEVEDGIDSTSSDSEDSGDSDLDQAEIREKRLRRSLDKLRDQQDADNTGSNLNSLKFMQRVEDAKRAQNDEAIAEIQRDLDGGGELQEEAEESVGRRIFGPGRQTEIQAHTETRTEFEEEEWGGIDDEDSTPRAFEIPVPTMIDPTIGTGQGPAQTKTLPRERGGRSVRNTDEGSTASLGSSTNALVKATGNGSTYIVSPTETHAERHSDLLRGEKHSQPDTHGWITVSYEKDGASDAEGSDSPAADSPESEAEVRARILAAQFAGDDVEAAFEKEKGTVVEAEDEKVVDETLPGWGSWVGEGVSERELRRHTGRILTKHEGIRPQDRQDAKLRHVIINQKRIRKNAGYLASTLPFPYTTKAEYERSIRMPIGKEWNIKETFHENTKPRVLVKPGTVIAPMEKPLR